MEPSTISIIILAISVVFYITEKFPIPIVAMSSCALMVIFGVLPADVAWATLAKDSVLLVAGTCVVGAAVYKTGAADLITRLILKLVRGKPQHAILALLTLAAVLSAFINNATATAIFLPLILGIVIDAKDENIYEQKYMLLLGILVNTGGMITLIGSSINISASAVYSTMGGAPFPFFAMAPIALLQMGCALLWAYTIGGKYSNWIFGKTRRHSDFVLQYMQTYEEKKAREVRCAQQNPEEAKRKNRRKWTSLIIMLLMAAGLMTESWHGVSFGTVAVAAALLCVFTRCLTAEESYKSIDLSVILLLAGIVGTAAGVSYSGGGDVIAGFVLGLFGGNLSPWVLFILFCVLAAILTQFISNTGTCGILIPVAYALAVSMNINPLPLALGITMCTTVNATPMSSPVQAMVFNWGSYKFADYIKYSTPLMILFVIIVIIFTPMFYPL